MGAAGRFRLISQARGRAWRSAGGSLYSAASAVGRGSRSTSDHTASGKEAMKSLRIRVRPGSGRLPLAVALLAALLGAEAHAEPITEAPALVAPFDGMITANRPPFFNPAFGLRLSWHDVANEDAYQLEIVYTPLSGPPATYLLPAGRDAEGYRLITFPPDASSGTLLPGRYVWRVRGVQGSFAQPTQTGPWSPSRLFQVYVDLPYLEPPDVYPTLGPVRIDYRDVLAFALAWQGVYPNLPYGLAADADKNGVIDEMDLTQLVAYFRSDDYDALLPALEVQNASQTFADYSAVAAGTVELQLTWQRVSAYGYYVEVAYAELSQLEFLPDPGTGATISLAVNRFVTGPEVYNLRVAAIDHRYITGRWSPFFRFIVEDQ